MKKNLLLILCVISLLVSCLASCEKECEHTFSDEWMSDSENHWHPATCEHAETEREAFAPHVDENEDGICDTCEYSVGHEHSFVDSWTVTDTHHWKVSTCSHKDEKKQYELHVDEDKDSKCDVCAGHVHEADGAGYCKYDDCRKKIRDIDETSLEDLVNAVYTQKYLVNGGNIDLSFNGQSNTSASFVAQRNEVVNYLFGKDNYTYIKVMTDVVNAGVSESDVRESWTQLDGPESTFGVYSVNGGGKKLDVPDVAKLNGYYVALSTFVGEYGVEETLYALYSIAVGNVDAEEGVTTNTKDLVTVPNADENKVTFMYSYTHARINPNKVAVGDENTPSGSMIYNVNLFEVEVTFCYSDDFALTSLDIKVDCYTNDPGTADGVGFLYKDVDISYDPDTQEIEFIEYEQDENGNWVAHPTDKRTPDTYVISVSQTIGDRTEENPQNKSKFVPTKFDIYDTINEIYDEEGLDVIRIEFKNKITAPMTVSVGDVANIYIGNYYPENTSLHFVANYVTFKLYKDGVLVENPEQYDNPIATAMFVFGGSASTRSFFVVPRQVGVYKLEIYVLDKLEKTVSVIAGEADIDNIELKENEFAVKVTEAHEWTNEVTFTATTAGTYYFNLPAGVGFINADGYDAAESTPATDDTPDPYFDYNNAKAEDGSYIPGSFSVKLGEGESIRFYVNALKKGTYVISFFSIEN